MPTHTGCGCITGNTQLEVFPTPCTLSPSSSSCGLRVKTLLISSKVSVSPMAAMQNTRLQVTYVLLNHKNREG